MTNHIENRLSALEARNQPKQQGALFVLIASDGSARATSHTGEKLYFQTEQELNEYAHENLTGEPFRMIIADERNAAGEPPKEL